MLFVPSRDRPGDRAARRGIELTRRIGREIRSARRAAGVSQDAIGAAAGVSGSEVGRIERGEAPWLTIIQASRLLGTVGLGFWGQPFPDGQPLRDAAHGRLLARFEARLPPHVQPIREWRFDRTNHQAIDLLLVGPNLRIGVEAETVVDDEQALIRKMASRKAAAGLQRMVLLVLDSQRNRRALAAAEGLRRALPLGTRAVMSALTQGRDPGGDGIAVL